MMAVLPVPALLLLVQSTNIGRPESKRLVHVTFLRKKLVQARCPGKFVPRYRVLFLAGAADDCKLSFLQQIRQQKVSVVGWWITMSQAAIMPA
jgi:hypothetical protein